MIARKHGLSRTARWGFSLALVAWAAPAQAQNLGMLTDNDGTPSVLVFDADTDTFLGEVALPGSSEALDCEMLDNQTLGFVAGWTSGVWVIDLSNLAAPAVNIPVPNIHVENLAISRDQRFLFICDGGGGVPPDPVQVMDLATLTLIDLLDTGEDHNSIVVCDNGSLLTTGRGNNWFTPAYAPHLRRIEVDGMGHLTDTGEVVHFPDAMYAAFSPTCDFAVLNSTDGGTGKLRSFTSPGLTPVDTVTSGGRPICGVMHPGADLYYVRTSHWWLPWSFNSVELWNFDQLTGQFVGSAPTHVAAVGAAIPFFGVEQMSLHPDRTKLYVLDDSADSVHILDPADLSSLGTISGLPASFSQPAGISFRTVSVPLAVDLEYLRARRLRGGKVVVQWGTAAELENAGFKIYREAWSPAPSGLPTATATLVTPSLIPARGTPFQPTVYRWTDAGAAAGQAYNYWLVDVDLHGETTTHGPISVR